MLDNVMKTASFRFKGEYFDEIILGVLCKIPSTSETACMVS